MQQELLIIATSQTSRATGMSTAPTKMAHLNVVAVLLAWKELDTPIAQVMLNF